MRVLIVVNIDDSFNVIDELRKRGDFDSAAIFAIEELFYLGDVVFVGAAPCTCRVGARKRNQRYLPDTFDQAASLRVARDASMVGNPLTRQRPSDRMVDFFACFPGAVI